MSLLLTLVHIKAYTHLRFHFRHEFAARNGSRSHTRTRNLKQRRHYLLKGVFSHSKRSRDVQTFAHTTKSNCEALHFVTNLQQFANEWDLLTPNTHTYNIIYRLRGLQWNIVTHYEKHWSRPMGKKLKKKIHDKFRAVIRWQSARKVKMISLSLFYTYVCIHFGPIEPIDTDVLTVRG